MKRYGLPYQGSKNAIAEWVVGNLPPGECFVDLFCGGCAITHAAMLTKKWKRFIINDLNPLMPQAFVDAVQGKFADERRWISRDDFFRLRDVDAYASICFSFGNSCFNYAYNPSLEPIKRAAHYALLLNDYKPLEVVGGDAFRRLRNFPLREAYLTYRRIVRELVREAYEEEREDAGRSVEAPKRPQGLQSLQSLERLERLQSLERQQSLQSLQNFNLDYAEVEIPRGAVVYCDIPYKGTSGYRFSAKFDHARFYEWSLSRKFPVFVSEYALPGDFVPIAACVKDVNFSQKTRGKAVEKIFVQKRYAAQYSRDLFGFD